MIGKSTYAVTVQADLTVCAESDRDAIQEALQALQYPASYKMDRTSISVRLMEERDGDNAR